MRTQFNWIRNFSAAIIVCATATLPVAAAQITASLDSDSIVLGDSAQLTVTISGNDNAQPELPAVSGLEFTPVGQSSSFQSINGAVTVSVGLTYQVTPDRAGTFIIPAIRLPGGESSQPISLRVLKNAGTASAPLSSSLPFPNVQSGITKEPANPNGEPAFLRVVLPKQQFYIGELVPVQVKAYFRAGMAASLNGLPVLSSDAFTLNKLEGKPEQKQEMVGGWPYTVVTWPSALSAVKSGDYAVNLELPVVVRVPDRRNGGNNPFKQFFGNSGFNDPAFDDFFGGLIEKPLTLRTDLENIKVLPLPTAGRPADFNGAVGTFDVTNEAAPTQLTIGDPITVRLKVSGQGNFDRVNSRGLEPSAEWKTYPPSALFVPADNTGCEGTKTFEQAVVPLKAGSEKIPALTFSYFDPDTRQYVTHSTTAISIDVAPDKGTSSVAALPASPTNSIPSPAVSSSASELAPNKVETGKFVSSLRPVLFSPWFITLQGSPAMVLIAGLLIHWRQERLAQDPSKKGKRAAQAAVREHIAAMEQALATNSAPAFFSAARQVMQEQLARCWQISVSQVTSAEINRRLNGDSGVLRTLFAVADGVVYSGQRVPPAELQNWKDTVMQQLKKMEAL